MPFSTKALIGRGGKSYFYVSYWGRDRHFSWSSEPRDALAICWAKVVPPFLSNFKWKTLSVGPVPGIEPTTSRSAVKRSADWANPAAVILENDDYSFLSRPWNKRNYSTPISEMFSTFITEKLFENTCKATLQAASAYKRREFWRETHTPPWLMIGRIIFLTREKTSSWFLLDVSSFSRVEIIVLSSDWLEIICDWKIFFSAMFYFNHCQNSNNTTRRMKTALFNIYVVSMAFAWYEELGRSRGVSYSYRRL